MHLNSEPGTMVIEIRDVGLTEQELRQELAADLSHNPISCLTCGQSRPIAPLR